MTSRLSSLRLCPHFRQLRVSSFPDAAEDDDPDDNDEGQDDDHHRDGDLEQDSVRIEKSGKFTLK